MPGVEAVVIDGRLRGRLLMANLGRAERVAFLLGRREEGRVEVVAAAFTPLTEASETHAVFDMRWFTILRTTLRRLDLEPYAGIVGWMHSHPRMSIFLSATDLPTAESFRRYDPLSVAVVVNPYDPDDPIGGFAGAESRRIPVEFRSLYDFPRELLERLAAIEAALPEFTDLILPDWVGVDSAHFRRATMALGLRTLEGQQFLLQRLEAIERRQREDAGTGNEAPASEPGTISGLERRVAALEHQPTPDAGEPDERGPTRRRRK